MNPAVAIRSGSAAYCATPPYHPAEAYPELPFPDRSPEPNPAYALVRLLLRDLGMDAAAFGSPGWNPLGGLIRPGDTVVLKPNFVLDRNSSGDDLFAVITHPSVLRALADYAWIALQGRGRIVIADAPQMDCSWQGLMEQIRLDAIQAFYRDTLNFPLEVHDLRSFELIDPRSPAYSSNRRPRPGDPAGTVRVDLGARSAFAGMESARFYGADYDRAATIQRHRDGRHEYEVSATVLAADVVLSVPKLKVHKKVGVTLNLKGLVGINTNKNCLIHYRVGQPAQGGDQLPDRIDTTDAGLVRIQRWLFDHCLARQNRAGDAVYRLARACYRRLIKPFRPLRDETMNQDGGNWHGNDSAWRMTADLARIFLFADRAGRLHDTPQRRIFCLIDGIVAGEGEGPLAPQARKAGVLIAGGNPLAVDLVATRLMGLDIGRIKQFSILADPAHDFGLRDPRAIALRIEGAHLEAAAFFDPAWISPLPPFLPHSGWIGHLELKP